MHALEYMHLRAKRREKKDFDHLHSHAYQCSGNVELHDLLQSDMDFEVFWFVV